jgi:acyl-CoA thioesterase-2
MHGYFLAPGNNDKQIRYHIEKIKSGRSFDAVRVTATQSDKTIFILAASFHIKEESIEHQESMPNVPEPENLRPFSSIMEELLEDSQIELKGLFSPESPIIVHPVEYFNPLNPGKKPALSHIWFKPNGKLIEDDVVMTAAMLAYASDFNLLVTALRPHDVSFFKTPMQIASLDHAMYFHRWPISSDWHLYVVDSPIAMSSRAYCRGKIYSKNGDLVSSVGQEGLIRIFKK